VRASLAEIGWGVASVIYAVYASMVAVEKGELDKILEEQTSYTKSVAKSK
jgi:hypothetical protein